MAKKIRLGFVGTGFMGQRAHLINYMGLPDCEIVALAEPRKKMAEEVARRYGIREVYGDHLSLLAHADVDAIVAAQPFSHHIHIMPDILKAGKALLTEKPIAVCPESGSILAELAEKNHSVYMLGYHKRSDPAMEYAKCLIDAWKKSNEFGAMRMVRITMPPGNWMGGIGMADMISSDEAYPQIQSESPPACFDEATGKEYVSFVNYYIHQVNAMRFLLGEPYKVVFAEKSGVLMTVESASGIAGVLEMAPYSRTRDWEETLFVGFEKGYIEVVLPAPLAAQQPGVVTVYRDNGNGEPSLTQPVLPQVSAMRNQAMNFLAAIRGEKGVPCGPREAADDLGIAADYVRMRFL